MRGNVFYSTIICCWALLLAAGCVPTGAPRRESAFDHIDPQPVTRQRIERIDPELHQRTEAALALLAGGETRRAHDEFSRIVEADSLVFKAHAGLVTATGQLDELRLAQQWYERRLAASPADAGFHYGLALVLASDPSRLTAERLSDHLRILGLLAPDVADVAALEADVLQRQGHPDRAVQRWRRTLELDPDHAQALVQLAALEFDPRQPAPSVQRIERALAIMPEYLTSDRWEAHIAAGGMHLEAGRHGRAVEHYRSAEAINFHATWQRVDWAALMWRAGRRDEALDAWRRALDTLLVGSPAGLSAFRSYHALARGGLDYSNFLPTGPAAEYRMLFTHLGHSRAPSPVSVPHEFTASLTPDKPAYILRRHERWTLVVQASPESYFGTERYLSDPAVALFDGDRKRLGVELGLDHLLDARLIDLDGSGTPEVVVVGMDRLNSLKLYAFASGPQGYALAFQVASACMRPASGITVADIDGSGTFEIVSVSDIDSWPTIYRIEKGALREASEEFPEFYTYYRRLYTQQAEPAWSKSMEPQEAERVRQRVKMLESFTQAGD